MARKQTRPTEDGDGVATAEPGAEVVWKGNDLLRPFLIPIKNLREDPKNANTHPDRSIEAIASSYLRFGQAKPIICANDGTVKDGNGQLVAAAGLGWTHIAVIPSDLEGHELAAYALAVNRSSDLSEWNFEELARQLKELEGYGAETGDLGWEPDELEGLLQLGQPAAPPKFVGGGQEGLEFEPGFAVPGTMTLSQVRMVQLFLTVETYPVFQERVENLQESYGTGNATDTVMECLRRAAEPRGE